MNAFVGKNREPTDKELASALGPAKAVWDRLLNELASEHGVTLKEWTSYSPKAGWSLRAKRRVRTIVWLSPCQGSFNVLFILGGKAMNAARQSALPQRAVKALDAAIQYPEGTGVRLRVRSARDIGFLKKLAAIKIAN